MLLGALQQCFTVWVTVDKIMGSSADKTSLKIAHSDTEYLYTLRKFFSCSLLIEIVTMTSAASLVTGLLVFCLYVV